MTEFEFKEQGERMVFEEAVAALSRNALLPAEEARAILAQERSYREAGRCGVCGEAGNPNCTKEC